MARCKSCGAEIVWMKTKNRGNMPCDPSLIPFWAKFRAKGKVVTLTGDVVSCEFEGPMDDMTDVGRIPHWATCPYADRHRKR